MGWTHGRVLCLDGIGVGASFNFSAGTLVQFSCVSTYLNDFAGFGELV